jgi:hypothetical protein
VDREAANLLAALGGAQTASSAIADGEVRSAVDALIAAFDKVQRFWQRCSDKTPHRTRRPLGSGTEEIAEASGCVGGGRPIGPSLSEIRSCCQHERLECGGHDHTEEDDAPARPSNCCCTETEEGCRSETEESSGSDCGSSDGGDDEANTSDQEARMDNYFVDARRRLAAVQRLFAAGDDGSMRTEARALAQSAAGAGARSVQDAATKLWDGRGSGGGVVWAAWVGDKGPVRRAAVEGLELKMDAAEAIWRSCRIVV